MDEPKWNQNCRNVNLTNHPTCGDRMRYARKQSGLSQRTLAHRLGLKTHRNISQWENNKAEPNLTQLEEFCNITNTKPNWIVTGVDNPESTASPSHTTLTRDHRRIVDNLTRDLLSLQNK